MEATRLEPFFRVTFSVALFPGLTWKKRVFGVKLTGLCADAVAAATVKPTNKQNAERALAVILKVFLLGCVGFLVGQLTPARKATCHRGARKSSNDCWMCYRRHRASSNTLRKKISGFLFYNPLTT
jgi:hypothetical protein